MSARGSGAQSYRGLLVQCACTVLVAVGAAYASYRHGQSFALRFGADATTAAIWPLIVDGLLTMATVELWKPGRSGKWRAWLAFLFGVGLSLCANIASAPELGVFAVTVAACPPLALLLAVELLNRALKRRRAVAGVGATGQVARSEKSEGAVGDSGEKSQIETGSGRVLSRAEVLPGPCRRTATAEQRMWLYYQAQRARGRTPTGAELDRVAGTNNYGRRLIRRWHTQELEGSARAELRSVR